MDNKFLDLAKPSFLNPDLIRPDWTKDISRDEKLLWLNKNENIDPELNHKIKTLTSRLKSFTINTYPETAKIYHKLAKLDGLSPSNYLLTHGSDGAIRSVFDIFISPGDKVLCTRPTFAMYDVYTKIYGANVIFFDYQSSDNGPILNIESFFNLINEHKPKLICLPNPDSPTGTIISKNRMDDLLNLASLTKSLVLIDEAYFPIYPETVIKKVNDYKNLLVCRSFSKAWGAAGFRIGYLAAEVEMMIIIQKSRSMYELGTFSSELLNLLLDCEQEMYASVQRLQEGKEYFLKELNSMGFKTIPSFGNFVHVDFGSNSSKIEEALRYVVLYRSEFNNADCLKGLSRFSLAPVEQMKLIVNAIKSVVL